MLKIELLITYLFLVLTTGIYGQMYTSGRFIYTREGEKVVLRGVNEMLVWSSDPNGSWVMAEIAKTGANAVRISCQDDYSADKLEKAVQNANLNGMIVMPSIWHATGKWDQLQRCVDYWLRDDVKTALQNNESHLLLNIANEAGNNSITDAQFVLEYKKAITQLRDSGYQCPLVIDGTDWGKNYKILLKNWDELNKHDPLENIIVSAHNYWNGSERQRKNKLCRLKLNGTVPKVNEKVIMMRSFVNRSKKAFPLFLAKDQRLRLGIVPIRLMIMALNNVIRTKLAGWAGAGGWLTMAIVPGNTTGQLTAILEAGKQKLVPIWLLTIFFRYATHQNALCR